MAFKVNYGLERAERNRAKQAKKEAKAVAKKAPRESGETENDAPPDSDNSALPEKTPEA